MLSNAVSLYYVNSKTVKVNFLFGFTADVKLSSKKRREGDNSSSSVEKKPKSGSKFASSSSKSGRMSEDLNSLFRPDVVLVRSVKVPDSLSVRQTVSQKAKSVLDHQTITKRVTPSSNSGFSLEKLLKNLEWGCENSGATSQTSGSKHPGQCKGLNATTATWSNTYASTPKNVVLGENTASTFEKSALADDDIESSISLSVPAQVF